MRLSQVSSSNHPSQMRLNLLIDLSGTLHIGDNACEGAINAIKRLSKAKPNKSKCTDFKVRFCSNTTKESKQDLQNRLINKVGFEREFMNERRIMTSLQACIQLCLQKQWKPLLLLTPSAQKGFRDLMGGDKVNLKEKRISHAFFPDPEKTPSMLSKEEHQSLRECDTVIVGLAPRLFTAEWLDEAFRILSDEYSKEPKQLVATHRALYFRPANEQPLSMGPGAYINALEAASRRSPDHTIVCGKPSTTFLHLCLDDMEQERKQEGTQEKEDSNVRNIIIGDDIEADLGGGSIELKLERVLVQTGKYREKDEDHNSDHPVKVFKNFAEFVQKELFDTGLLLEGGKE